MDASLLPEIQIKVLQYLSFKDLYKILSLGKDIWGLPGLRGLWEIHMDRYNGRCSVEKNVEAGQELTWEWIENRLYKIREMDLFIWARKQGRLGLDDQSVCRYLESGAREACVALHTLDIEWDYTPDFSRQFDIWTS